MGTANVVYVSIPDDSGGATTTCNLGLPALPGGWTYQCSNTDNYRKADGTGWIPVNFTSLTTTPNPLTLLPVDPTNSTSTNLYYTYVSGSWELTALFETTGYQTKYAASDNGTSTVLFEVGNHLKITPNAIASRSNVGGGGGQQTSVPTLTTSAATNVQSTSATLNGSITAEGGASSTIVGFQYGLTTSYGTEVTSTYSGGTGSFSQGITGLTGSTTYHFKAEARNSAGWGYGSDNVLTTSAPAFCTQNSDKNTSTTISGDKVYCDNSLRMWTPTVIPGGTLTAKTWGPNPGSAGGSCIGLGSSYPACNYCDTLTYAGLTGWQLPTKDVLTSFWTTPCGSASCGSGNAGISWDTNAQATYYWSSTEYSSNGAWDVNFISGNVSNAPKSCSSCYVRCVRGQ